MKLPRYLLAIDITIFLLHILNHLIQIFIFWKKYSTTNKNQTYKECKDGFLLKKNLLIKIQGTNIPALESCEDFVFDKI